MGMDHLDHSKSIYFHEVSRKNDLNSSIAFPAGVIGALAAGIATIATSLDGEWRAIEWICFIASTFTVIFLAIAALYLARSYHGYTYRYIPIPTELAKWRSSLQPALSLHMAEEYYQLELIKLFDEGSAVNTVNNDIKSTNLYRATFWILLALSSFAISSGGYIGHKIGAKPLKGEASSTTIFYSDRGEHENDAGTLPSKPAAASPTTPNARYSGKRVSARRSAQKVRHRRVRQRVCAN